jgi:hypothetical protein
MMDLASDSARRDRRVDLKNPCSHRGSSRRRRLPRGGLSPHDEAYTPVPTSPNVKETRGARPHHFRLHRWSRVSRGQRAERPCGNDEGCRRERSSRTSSEDGRRRRPARGRFTTAEALSATRLGGLVRWVRAARGRIGGHCSSWHGHVLRRFPACTYRDDDSRSPSARRERARHARRGCAWAFYDTAGIAAARRTSRPWDQSSPGPFRSPDRANRNRVPCGIRGVLQRGDLHRESGARPWFFRTSTDDLVQRSARSGGVARQGHTCCEYLLASPFPRTWGRVYLLVMRPIWTGTIFYGRRSRRKRKVARWST